MLSRNFLLAASMVATIACGESPSNDGATASSIDDAAAAPATDGGVAESSADATEPPTPGLRAEYFAGYLDRALVRVEATLDDDWGDAGAPSSAIGHDHFSARWTGSLIAPTSGTYTIATYADDGVRVWVGGQKIIDDWQGHFVTRDQATIDLKANVPVPIRVEYFQLDLKASMRLVWSTAGSAEQVIPASSLVAAPAPSGLPGPKPPFANPVIAADCPDPGVVTTQEADGPHYALVCTGGTFPIHTSRSLVSWDSPGPAILPSGKPPWAANGDRNWAPEIHVVGNHLVAYYTSVDSANVLSIGVSYATSVLGPYTPTAAPLAEDPEGVIDPTFFRDDDGTQWAFYKIDGNATGQPAIIYARKLSADGLSFAPGSAPIEVLRNDPGTWEHGVVEAPWVEKRNGTYYLFYSGSVYDVDYRPGVARSASVVGPYTKHGAPLLVDNDRWLSPGHGCVVTVNGLDYFVYHAWPNANGALGNGRHVLVDRITWANGWPAIANGSPSSTAQPWPGEIE